MSLIKSDRVVKRSTACTHVWSSLSASIRPLTAKRCDIETRSDPLGTRQSAKKLETRSDPVGPTRSDPARSKVRPRRSTTPSVQKLGPTPSVRSGPTPSVPPRPDCDRPARRRPGPDRHHPPERRQPSGRPQRVRPSDRPARRISRPAPPGRPPQHRSIIAAPPSMRGTTSWAHPRHRLGPRISRSDRIRMPRSIGDRAGIEARSRQLRRASVDAGGYIPLPKSLPKFS